MDYVQASLCELKSQGLKITKGREGVLSLLAEAKQSLDAQEIHKLLDEQNLKIDLVTVYRILETLLENKLVHKVDNSYLPCSHSQCSSSWHVVTRCESCGATEENHIPESKLKSFQKFLSADLNFHPQKHPLVVTGTCSQCL